MNCVGIELAYDAGLRFVLAKTEHAEAWNQHDRRVGIAQGGRVCGCELVVIAPVLFAIFGERFFDLYFEPVETCARIPGHKERAYFGADKVIGAAGAEER